MSRPVLAWSSATAGVAFVCGGAVLSATAGAASTVFFALVVPLVLATSVVGGLVASRHPASPIGWIFCGFSVWPAFTVRTPFRNCSMSLRMAINSELFR